MVLYETAYLQIDDGAGTTATFELSIDLEETVDGEKSYVMGNRGQFISEIADNAVQDLSIDTIAQRRSGYFIDGGGGQEIRTLEFKAGLNDARWGDENSDTGPSGVTATDASGEGVKPLDRKQVMGYWLRRTRTDSFGQARLHWGQWTDGSYTDDVVSAGSYGEPIPVAVLDWSLGGPPTDDSSSFEGALTLQRVAPFPDEDMPDWLSNAAEVIDEQLSGVPNR